MQGGRGWLRNEANYLYHPSSHSFRAFIKIQSITPQHNPQLVELSLCVLVTLCVHAHEESEAQFRVAVLRLAAGKVCNEELPAFTFML